MSKLEKVLLNKGIKIETTNELATVPINAFLVELEADNLILVFQKTLNRVFRQKVICEVLNLLKEGALFSGKFCIDGESNILCLWKKSNNSERGVA